MTPLALSYQPPWGWPVVFVLIGAAVAPVVWLALRHERVLLPFVLRLVGLAVGGWVLLGPTVDIGPHPGDLNDAALPELVLLADRSASMAILDTSVPGR